MVTCEYSVGSMFFVLSKVSETSARLAALRLLEPLKIMFSIFSERSVRVLCSPSTHLMASTTFDLPHPFGPTIAVTPSLKFMVTLSPKLLNPLISKLLSCIYDVMKVKGKKVKGERSVYSEKQAFILLPLSFHLK